MALILDGKKVAAQLYEKIALDVSLLPFVPKVVFVLVGEDPASQTYVRSKAKKCLDLGFQGETRQMSATITQDDLLAAIRELNRDGGVHGILVQLPLPKSIDKFRVMAELDPLKDVDGLHPYNVGRLMQGDPRFVPCTPAGIIEILKSYQLPIAGKKAVVVGRSEIVGKPMAQLLLMNDATVTVAHSKTADLARETSQADILVAAMGKPRFIGPQHVKAGAVVIDVGIHRLADRLVGDVDFEAVEPKVSAITPVPGGVGPMTIAMLMKNVAQAATLAAKGR